MSYARKTRRTVQRYRNISGHRVAIGMGDALTDALQGQCSDPDFYNGAGGWMAGCHITWPDGPPPAPTSQAQQCVVDSATLTAPLDAKVADLAQNWHPTGFYSASDMLTVTRSVQALLSGAQGMLQQVGPSANQSDITDASNELFRHMAQNTTYTQAAGKAGSTPINAPGFKDFVLNAMNSASAAMTAAYVVSCTTPWWVSALATFQSGFDAVWNVCKRVVGLAVSAGAAVLTVAEETAGIMKYLPYAAAAVGAYIVIVELGRYKKRRRA